MKKIWWMVVTIMMVMKVVVGMGWLHWNKCGPRQKISNNVNKEMDFPKSITCSFAWNSLSLSPLARTLCLSQNKNKTNKNKKQKERENYVLCLSNKSFIKRPRPYFIKVKIILSLKFKINLIFYLIKEFMKHSCLNFFYEIVNKI